MICLIFVALTLKVLLSHINTAHSRSPEFWVYCGIDGCEKDFRVFNSFFVHIKRTHASFFKHGDPPRGWTGTPTSRSLGTEKFGVQVFGNCTAIITPQETAPGPSRSETPQPEVIGPVSSLSISIQPICF